MLFRGLLVIPHLIWLTLGGLLAFIATPFNWATTIVLGRSLASLHDFLAAYLTYSAHVTADLRLIANPYPGFTSTHTYPVTVKIDEPVRQRRLSAVARWFWHYPRCCSRARSSGTCFGGSPLATGSSRSPSGGSRKDA